MSPLTIDTQLSPRRTDYKAGVKRARLLWLEYRLSDDAERDCKLYEALALFKSGMFPDSQDGYILGFLRAAQKLLPNTPGSHCIRKAMGARDSYGVDWHMKRHRNGRGIQYWQWFGPGYEHDYKGDDHRGVLVQWQ